MHRNVGIRNAKHGQRHLFPGRHWENIALGVRVVSGSPAWLPREEPSRVLPQFFSVPGTILILVGLSGGRQG